MITKEDCIKKKMDKISAMLVLAKNRKQIKVSLKRREARYYFCTECSAYHLTSKTYKTS